MSFQNNKMNSLDKVNMSLDDIIKMNRKENRQNRFATNRNNYQNNNGFKQNNQQPRQQRKQRMQANRPVNNNRMNNNNNNNNMNYNNKNKFGILNQSKMIKKRRPNNNNVNNRGGGVRILANRLGNGNSVQKMSNRMRFRRRQNATGQRLATNRLFNRQQSKTVNKRVQNNGQIKKPKFVINQMPVKSQQQQQQQQNRRRLLNQNSMRSKIAMQAARKNVQKAKRVLATRKAPIKQIMTQHYAKRLGIGKPKSINPVRRQRKAVVQKSANKLAGGLGVRRQMRNNSKMLRVSINNKVNKMANAIQARKQTKKPILNRNRSQQSQQQQTSGSNRLVFY